MNICVKGSQVYIEGQLRTRKWTDQAGVEKYTTEVVVNVGGTMQMLGGRSQNLLRLVISRKAASSSAASHRPPAQRQRQETNRLRSTMIYRFE